MTSIIREPQKTAEKTFDLIIIGGGVYGVMLSLEASLAGLRVLLLERGDFGQHTSFNSLRIIHGGLRYLQNLDLCRYRESVGEQIWFLRTFPGLVKPLPCLMPLYGQGLRRPSILQAALWANHALANWGNKDLRLNHFLPRGQVVSPAQTKAIFPLVDQPGLKGGAVWYDAIAPDSQILLMSIMRWASQLGAMALNYFNVCQLLKCKGSVAGVVAVDQTSGETQEFAANAVVNACGPWCRNVAARFDRDHPALFKGSLAWNVLLDIKSVTDHAVAVTAKKRGERTYFLLPWKGMIIAGTGHAPWFGGEGGPIVPSPQQIEEFLDDLNLAVPSLCISEANIIHVFAGLLPADRAGTVLLATRPIIFDHAKNGGPLGLYTVSGVKFTTARLVAEKTVKHILAKRKKPATANPKHCTPPKQEQNRRGIYEFDWRPSANDSKWKNALRQIILEESVQHLDDLIYRRTTLWENPSRALEVAPLICELFDWDPFRRLKEIKRLTKIVGSRWSS